MKKRLPNLENNKQKLKIISNPHCRRVLFIHCDWAETLQKMCVSTDFRNRKLVGKIMLFYAVITVLCEEETTTLPHGMEYHIQKQTFADVLQNKYS